MKGENYENKNNYHYMNIWYDIAGEMKKTLSPNSKYYVRFNAVFNGKRYYSGLYSFRTPKAPAGRVAKSNYQNREENGRIGIVSKAIVFFLTKKGDTH